MRKKRESSINLPGDKTSYLFMKSTLREMFGSPGSTETQIALLTSRITYLSQHLKNHRSDHSSRRGLLKLVGKRRRLLRYLKRSNPESFASITKALGLRAQ